MGPKEKGWSGLLPLNLSVKSCGGSVVWSTKTGKLCCYSQCERGRERKNVGDVAENGSYISVFVMINFAFKIGKSPLAAKRE